MIYFTGYINRRNNILGRTGGKKKLAKALVLLLAVSLLVTGCGGGAGKTGEKVLEKVTVTLDWTPNTNHTGLYVADKLGYYKEAGLQVEIIQPAGGTAEQLVAAGQAQFGVSYQEGVTYARAAGIPVVSIAAVLQHNTSGFAALAEKGIKTPADFAGKRYGGWGSPVEDATIKALMEKEGADFSKVEILTTGAVDFFAASEKHADFSWIFYGWDGIAAEIKGIPLDFISLTQYGEEFDYYTPVLITSEKVIAENPELGKKFMAATQKGYVYAIANPEEAAKILLEYAPELDETLVKASQKWLAQWYQAEAPYWGMQDSKVWERYTRWLVETGLLDKEIPVEKAFTNEFLVQ